MKRHRLIVENTIGALKMRFGILRQVLRVRKQNIGDLFFSCVILHNFLMLTGTPLRPEADEVEEDMAVSSSDDDDLNEAEENIVAEGVRTAFAMMN